MDKEIKAEIKRIIPLFLFIIILMVGFAVLAVNIYHTKTICNPNTQNGCQRIIRHYQPKN